MQVLPSTIITITVSTAFILASSQTMYFADSQSGITKHTKGKIPYLMASLFVNSQMQPFLPKNHSLVHGQAVVLNI
jgi:hypothetical protein